MQEAYCLRCTLSMAHPAGGGEGGPNLTVLAPLPLPSQDQNRGTHPSLTPSPGKRPWIRDQGYPVPPSRGQTEDTCGEKSPLNYALNRRQSFYCEWSARNRQATAFMFGHGKIYVWEFAPFRHFGRDFDRKTKIIKQSHARILLPSATELQMPYLILAN